MKIVKVLVFFAVLCCCMPVWASDDGTFIYQNLFLRSRIPHHISVFISGAERIGTSWCALSVAHALNLFQHKVLLVDGTGNFSNIDSYLQLQDRRYLKDYIKGKKTLNQLTMPYKSKNFHILTDKYGNNFLEKQPIGRIQLFTEDLLVLTENYDYSIIDAGTGFTCKNINLCQIADNILVMCSESSADLIKTFDLIRLINEKMPESSYYLVINKVNSFEDGYKVYEKLNKASARNGLKCPNLLGIVRFDARIRDTLRNKELLLSRYPASEAATDISTIAKKLSQEI